LLDAAVIILLLTFLGCECKSDVSSLSPDSTPPSVVSTVPEDGAIGVAVDAVVTAVFSEEIDPASVGDSGVALMEADTDSVVAAFIDVNKATVYLTPSGKLKYSTSYNVIADSAIRDLSGNVMASDYSWSFTTSDYPFSTVYYTSFENDEDLEGWTFNGTRYLGEGSPQGGGEKSLHISCGCIWPCGRYVIPATDTDEYYKVSFWGKKGLSDEIGLAGIGTDYAYPDLITSQITNSDWTHYEDDRLLYCPAGKVLMILILGGGFAGDAEFYVDCIKVEKLN